MTPSKKQTNIPKRTEASDLNSVVDILSDVDQFIKEIYRDFSFEPTPEQSEPTPKQYLPVRSKSTAAQSEPVSSNSNVNTTESIDTSSQPSSLQPSSLQPTLLQPPPLQPSSSSSSLTFRKQQANLKEPTANLDLESVGDLLENVDQFIEGVYRDMTNNAKSTQSFSRNPVSFKTLTPTSLPVASSVGAITSALPTSSNGRGRNMNTDNRVSSNIYPTSTAATTSSKTVNRPSIPAQQSTLRYVRGGSNGRETRQRTTAAPTQYIDLSESETHRPNVQRPPQNDEDVLFVESNINPVINMVQSSSRELPPPPIRRQTANEVSVQFSGRRMYEPVEDVISVVLGPSVAQRRRIEISFNWNPIQTIVPTNTTTQSNNNTPQTCNIPQTNATVQSNNQTPQTNTTTTQSNETTAQATNIAAASTDSQNPPFMCAVCMESSLQRQPTSTRCGHIFCNECIRHAIRLTHKCPLCNTKITDNQIFRIYL